MDDTGSFIEWGIGWAISLWQAYNDAIHLFFWLAIVGLAIKLIIEVLWKKFKFKRIDKESFTNKRVILLVLLVGLVVVAIVIWNGVLSKQKEEQEIDKCFAYLNSQNYQLALQTGKNAVELYPNSADAHWCLGAAYYYLGDFNLSIEELKTAEKLASSEKALDAIYLYLGGDYEKLNDFNTALLYYNKSLKIDTDLNDTKHEVTNLNNIANVYDEMGNYDKALEYYNKSLQLTSDPNTIATIYNRVGMIYEKKGDHNKAIDYIKKAIEIDQANGNHSRTVLDMICIASPYINLGNFSEAERYLTQGLEIAKKLDDKSWEAYVYIGLSSLYSVQNQEALAEEYRIKAYNLFKSIGNNSEAQGVYKTYLNQ
jgi:tetratricopeptide (TPR) repeat protein